MGRRSRCDQEIGLLLNKVEERKPLHRLLKISCLNAMRFQVSTDFCIQHDGAANPFYSIFFLNKMEIEI